MLLDTFIKSTPTHIFLLLIPWISKYGFYIQSPKEAKNIISAYHQHAHTYHHHLISYSTFLQRSDSELRDRMSELVKAFTLNVNLKSL